LKKALFYFQRKRKVLSLPNVTEFISNFIKKYEIKKQLLLTTMLLKTQRCRFLTQRGSVL